MGVVDTCGHYLVILTQESRFEGLITEKSTKVFHLGQLISNNHDDKEFDKKVSLHVANWRLLEDLEDRLDILHLVQTTLTTVEGRLRPKKITYFSQRALSPVFL